jgi:hypothetical protein
VSVLAVSAACEHQTTARVALTHPTIACCPTCRGQADEGASAAGGPVTATLRVGLKAEVDAGGGEAFVHEVPWRSPVTLAEQQAKSAVTLKGESVLRVMWLVVIKRAVRRV